VSFRDRGNLGVQKGEVQIAEFKKGAFKSFRKAASYNSENPGSYRGDVLWELLEHEESLRGEGIRAFRVATSFR